MRRSRSFSRATGRPGVLVALAVAFAVLSASCRDIPKGAFPADPHSGNRVDLRIAFVGAYDGATGGPATRSLEGARLALDQANETQATPQDLLLISVNTQGDPVTTTEAVAEKIIADPEVVAVIGWPSTPEAWTLRDTLSSAGIGYIDLSPAIEPVGDTKDPQRLGRIRMVPDDIAQATTIAQQMKNEEFLTHYVACIGGDGEPRGVSLQGLVDQQLGHAKRVLLPQVEPGQSDYAELAGRVGAAECSVLFWAGEGTDAAVVRSALDAEGLQAVRLIGPDTMRSEAYLSATAAAGENTVTVCPCALLSDQGSVDLAAFIQSYQAKYGGSPGAYSMEGFDAGSIVVDAVDSGATTRAQIAAYIDGIESFDGIGAVYSFDERGRRVGAKPSVAIQRASRWTV